VLGDICDDESDLVASASGNGVYGGGEPRLMEDLGGSTTVGGDGVKRKGRVGKETQVAVDARLRLWVLMADDDVRWRDVGEVIVAEVLPRL
jgi:hypothetical protein